MFKYVGVLMIHTKLISLHSYGANFYTLPTT